jgi:hypothetical protein
MTKNSELGREKLITLRQEIINNAVAHGENRAAVTAYVNSILTIPTSVPPTKLQVDDAAALAALQQFNIDLQNLRNQQVIIPIHTSGGVPGGTNITGGERVSTKASGGYITGAGTGTSDSIPAMLSNGEFVINAAQTAKHKDLLNAINKGAQGFADGGIVTLTPTPKKSSSSHSSGHSTHASTAASGTTRSTPRSGHTSRPRTRQGTTPRRTCTGHRSPPTSG